MNNRLGRVSTTTAQNAQARDGLYQTVRDNAFTAGKRKPWTKSSRTPRAS
jgi:hypothetical protein